VKQSAVPSMQYYVLWSWMLVVTPRCCNVISVGRFICGGPSDGLLKLSSIDVLLIRAATADWYIRSER